ncbi:urease accessory UreF family protein [uncultured Jannaschia sp.]|uniref:urease accessory protein UreF n=1 Tax=uncultured Jannaschia sp. TaxID=293347 RepID=UPI0026226D88|nr:urease accessory UreF family protein [uncultured Jannaschia sp.]
MFIIPPMHMDIDARLLTLTQWLSPAYPLGAFAYSQGVESAVASGWVTDAESLVAWLRDTLTDGTGRTDAIWLRLAHAAPDAAALARLDAEARAFAATRERLREAERQGTAFAATTRAVWGIDLHDLLLPLAVGRAARLGGLDIEAVVALYLHGIASNLATASMRLLPVGQVAAQRIVADLTPLCLNIARTTRDAGPEDIHANTFLADIASMRHEKLEPRLFQS